MFPSPTRSRDPSSGVVRRHHLHESGVQRGEGVSSLYHRLQCFDLIAQG